MMLAAELQEWLTHSPSRSVSRPATSRCGASSLFCALVLFATPLAALDPQKAITQYGLDRWTRFDGLPSNAVHSILQTRDGYLWIGTEEGLARFDGVRFTVFDSENTEALVEQNIRGLFEDRDGTLWIATPDYLASMRDGRWSNIPLPEGYAGPRHMAFHQSQDGTLWIGGPDKVGTLSEGRLKEFIDVEGKSLDGAGKIFETAGSTWFASGDLSELKDGRLSAVCAFPGGMPLECAVADHQTGAIWFGSGGRGLGRFQNGTCSYFTTQDGLSSNSMPDLLVDRDGSLWISPLNGSLQRYRKGFFKTLSEDDLHSNQINSLYEDREGNIWIATNGGGLGRLRDGKCMTYSSREGLGGAFVQAIAQGADGGVWIGTADGGLSRIDQGRVTARYTVEDGLASNFVACLWFDHEGILWIGTDGGLNRMSNGKIQAGPPGVETAGPVFFSIFEDREGVMWLGTLKGLYEYRDGKASLSHEITDIPTCITEDRSGRLWVGTYGGGLRCISAGTARTFTRKDGLSQDMVVSLHEDESGAIWIGTAGGGLNRYRDGKLAHVRARQGLFSDAIFSILSDTHGNLWMSCNNGIFWASKRDLDRCADGVMPSLSCGSFNESDGMRNRECFGATQTCAMKSRDGILWFATVDGAVLVDPEHIRSNPAPPLVHVELMTVNDKVVGSSISSSGFPSVLPPGGNRLEIAYTGLSFIDPEGLRFRCKLEGMDDNWVEGGNRRQAFYTNVPPGRYTFRVTAAGRDGSWNEAGDSISFRIRPHFYETTWFYALVALTIMAATYGGYRYRLEKLLEIERVRTRIAADLHDEIGAGLTHVTIISELIHTQLRNTQREAAELASQTADTARGLVDSLTDVVWAIDPKMDRVESLLIRIRQFASTVLEAKGIRFEMRAPESLTGARLRADVRRQVLLVCKEAVNNIVKYAACSSVTLDLAVRDGHITGEIVDDGQGFDTEHYVPKGSGRGLTSMRERVARLGGSLTFTSRPGSGTRVVFSIPL